MLENQNKFFDGEPGYQLHFLRSICLALIIAGNSTTSRTFYAFLNILLHYPDVMGKIQKEIDDVLGEQPVGLQHQLDMPYTKASIL